MREQVTLLGPQQAATDRSSLSALPKDLLEQVRGRVRLLALLFAAGFAVDPVLVLVVWTLATLTRHPVACGLVHRDIKPANVFLCATARTSTS